ncbi:hypothetical protein GGS26DRAFT_591193 [Hypomontagnella submonticulosa]|nr:hypothetical protein GGS26DRAFT_591193 [Hypomontagnella submonticulosa]
MQFSSALNLAALAGTVFLGQASAWSFTMYNANGCDNSTMQTLSSDHVEHTGNVACDPVPNPAQHKSVLGNIPAGSNCRVSFYPSKGCNNRIAFALTQYTTTCLSVADFVAPLAYYKATGCEGV